jgi:hypothetical protein
MLLEGLRADAVGFACTMRAPYVMRKLFHRRMRVAALSELSKPEMGMFIWLNAVFVSRAFLAKYVLRFA